MVNHRRIKIIKIICKNQGTKNSSKVPDSICVLINELNPIKKISNIIHNPHF
jgi:hypothetical protein